MGLGWNQNSFFISIDNGTDNHFEITQKNDATWDWWWSPAPPPDEYTDPAYFYKGSHTIRFKSREGGARLDAVLITDDSSYTPHEFTDCVNEWTNPVDNQSYVYVPAGEFLMGSVSSDSYAKYNEFPQHKVYLDGFWIARTEITNSQFAQFLNVEGNQSVDGVPWFRADAPGVKIEYRNGQWRVKSGWENHPVVNVSWHGAKAYAEWSGARLPSEAEWEKAARGFNAQRFPWGNDIPDCSRLNFFYNNDFCVGTTTSVGGYSSGISPYGAFDMAGNVWEWVNDRYDSHYYSSSPYRNPQGPSSGNERILRGGSWEHDIVFVRSAFRAGYDPNVRYSNTGFRPAITR
jgi:formylglycine-generating enzyme required for sulfatase activity